MTKLIHQETIIEGQKEEIDNKPSQETNIKKIPECRNSTVKRTAYRFDGVGMFYEKEWDLAEGAGNEFCWYHVELTDKHLHYIENSEQYILDFPNIKQSAYYLIEALCPPLKLQDIFNFISNGPFCEHVDGALVFRVNPPLPPSGELSFRFAARVTKSLVITVSFGKVPRLLFLEMGVQQSVLSEIPSVMYGKGEEIISTVVQGCPILKPYFKHLLNNHLGEADSPALSSASNLVAHIVQVHVKNLRQCVTNVEIQLVSLESQLNDGDVVLKRQLLEDRTFSNMHLDLQSLLQVISHEEQVFCQVITKGASSRWFAKEDIKAIEELVVHSCRLKENIGSLINRVATIQGGLDSWRAEQINRRLYYISIISTIFLPLSTIIGVFGMNVGGIPWTSRYGFRNVILLCVAVVPLVLLWFVWPFITRIPWQRKFGFLCGAEF